MTNLVKTTTNISNLRVGDTVEYNNELITVSKNDVKYNSFMGYSFRGDASKKIITKVQFAVPTAFGIVLR